MLLEDPLLLAPQQCLPILEAMVSFLVTLSTGIHAPLLTDTLKSMPSDYFARIVQVGSWLFWYKFQFNCFFCFLFFFGFF